MEEQVSLPKPSLMFPLDHLLFYCGGSDLQNAGPNRVVLSLGGSPKHSSPPQVMCGRATGPSEIPAIQVGLPAAAEPPAACRQEERGHVRRKTGVDQK